MLYLSLIRLFLHCSLVHITSFVIEIHPLQQITQGIKVRTGARMFRPFYRTTWRTRKCSRLQRMNNLETSNGAALLIE